MGLDVRAKGLTAETGFSCGYITFMKFRIELARTYNEELGEMYRNLMVDIVSEHEFSEKYIERWNELCNHDLDIFLFHSDCDGKFTPKECRGIYNAIKDLHMDMQGHNYGVMKPYNMLEHWKEIFKHCADRRINLYFE